jgi:hypothetical protein
MKTISAGLAQHLASEVTTLGTWWKIARRDAVGPAFTDHVSDLEVDGVTHKAASGYTRTAIRSTADLPVDNLDIESVFSDEVITEEDLRIGLDAPVTLPRSSLQDSHAQDHHARHV